MDRDRAAAAAPVPRSVAGDAAGANSHSWVWGLDFGTEVVADRRTSRIIDPPNGRFPEMTEAGKADAARRRGFGAILPADDYVDLGQGDRCLVLHGLPLPPLPYNNLVQLVQTPEHFVIYAIENILRRARVRRHAGRPGGRAGHYLLGLRTPPVGPGDSPRAASATQTLATRKDVREADRQPESRSSRRAWRQDTVWPAARGGMTAWRPSRCRGR